MATRRKKPQVSFTLTEDEKIQLKIIATYYGKSMSEMVGMMITNAYIKLEGEEDFRTAASRIGYYMNWD